MLRISTISTKALVISLISTFSLLAFILALYISSQFKTEAFKAHKRISSQFIQVAARESLTNLDELLSDFGNEIQSDKTLRKNFKNFIKGKLSQSELEADLNAPFSRRFHTAGFLYLQKIRAYDKNLEPLIKSSEGIANLPESLDPELKAIADARSGADKLKMLNHLWYSNAGSHYSVLTPIGGLKVIGFIEITVDPVHNLKQIKETLGVPIQIIDAQNTERYLAEDWPNQIDNHVLADYFFENSAGRKVLGIEAAFDNAELVGDVNQVRNYALGLFSAVTLVFVLFASWFLNRSLFKPVADLVEEMHEAASGNLTLNIDNFGIREVHTLSNSLEDFVSTLRNNVQLILENSNSLYQSATGLSNSADKNKKGIYVQQEQTEQVATAMNEMNATVAEVARNTSAAAEAAHSSQEKSVLGKEAVEKVVYTIKSLSENILTSEGLIEHLNEESKAIGSILDVITSISEQTNLLALNAAIEAARAGEAGRGFAVVADEVRTLATKTQESASDIRNMVESLREGTLGAVDSMNISRRTAEQAVKEITTAGETIDEVSSAVSLMSDINTQIATAAEQQTTVAEEINRNIVKIRDVGIENTSIANGTAEDGSNMLRIAEGLKSSVQTFKI